MTRRRYQRRLVNRRDATGASSAGSILQRFRAICSRSIRGGSMTLLTLGIFAERRDRMQPILCQSRSPLRSWSSAMPWPCFAIILLTRSVFYLSCTRSFCRPSSSSTSIAGTAGIPIRWSSVHSAAFVVFLRTRAASAFTTPHTFIPIARKRRIPSSALALCSTHDKSQRPHLRGRSTAVERAS